MRDYHLSRRRFLQGTAGSMAVAAGVPFSPWGAQQAFAAGLADQELRTVGLSVTVQERILNEFKEKSGVKAVSGKADIFPNTQTELLSGSTAYDCWETIGERLAAVVATEKITPIATSSLKNWANIRETFTKPSDRWEKQRQIVGQIWKDEGQTELWMVPTVYNYDSIGYRPDLVSAEEASSWTALFDPKFKGKTGLNVDPLIAFGQAVMAMNTLGLLKVENPGNPDKASIDEASKFLICEEEGRPVPRAVGRLRRTRQLAGLRRDDHRRRLAAGCDGGQGSRGAVLLRHDEGRLSRLGHWRIADCWNAEPRSGYGLCRLLAVRSAGHRRVGAGLLLAHHQHQGRDARRQICLLVRGQALGRRSRPRHQGR
jgi:hypothetical protein